MRFALIVLAIASTLANAQPAATFETNIGRSATALRTFDLHSKTRTGLFCDYGRVIDQVKKDETVQILDYRVVTCGLLRREHYVRVRRLNTGVPEDSSVGFVRLEVPDQTKLRLIPSQ